MPFTIFGEPSCGMVWLATHARAAHLCDAPGQFLPVSSGNGTAVIVADTTHTWRVLRADSFFRAVGRSGAFFYPHAPQKKRGGVENLKRENQQHVRVHLLLIPRTSAAALRFAGKLSTEVTAGRQTGTIDYTAN